jgi:hypothetical protein
MTDFQSVILARDNFQNKNRTPSIGRRGHAPS